MTRKLPPVPDFDKFSAAANDETIYDQRKMVSEAIGDLMINWANNESLLVYLLAQLLETDNQTAQITFFTLNTTQIRLELIKRLALFRLQDPVRSDTLKHLKHFRSLTNTRNELAHATYIYREDASIRATYNVRFNADFDGSKIGETKPIDQARYNEVRHVTKMLIKFNREMYAFLPVVEQHIQGLRAKPQGTPCPDHQEQWKETANPEKPPDQP